MIKLICSDLDGTLIPYGTPNELNEETYSLIRALTDRGMYFCPASGRQYTSLRKLFAPFADQCAYICENGAVVYYREALLSKTPMPREAAEEIALDFWQNTDGIGEVLLCGESTTYLMSRGHGIAERMEFAGNQFTFISHPCEVPEDIVKVSLYVREGVAAYARRFLSRWKNYNAAVAGPMWIDTTLADKGKGVLALCSAFDIAPKEVMAFGDNFNDAPMLDIAGTAYIVDSADPELLARYPRHCARPQEILRRLVDGREPV